MIRRLAFLALLLLLIPRAALAQSVSVPDLPIYSHTITLGPGQEETVQDAFTANSSCDSLYTRYTLVVKNGNPDGTGLVESGAAGVNGLDYVDDALADGATLMEVDAPLQSVNVAVMRAKAPPGAGAVLTMEIWRKPVTVTNHLQSYSFPQSTTNKNYTVSFTVANPSLPAMLIVTRHGGMQAADQFSIKVNNNNWFSRSNFSFSGQTLTQFIPLLANNTLKLDAVAASTASDVLVRIVQHGPDTTAPVLNLTGTIPAKLGTSSYTFNGNVTDANGIATLKLGDTKISFSSGSGAFTKAVTLTHGAPNEFSFVAYDCAGHGTKIVKTIEWDRDAPNLVVTSPAANAFVRGSVIVTGTAADDTSGNPAVTVNGVAATWSGTTWSATVPLTAPDGAKSLTVVATDSFQRASTVVVPVVRDATAPTITPEVAPQPNASGWTAGSTRVTFICSDANGIATCTDPQTISTSGTQTINGTATDTAGNQATTSITVKVDALLPALTLDATSPVVHQASFPIAGSVSDAHSGLVDVKCGETSATVTGSRFSCNATLLPGNNALAVTATDVAGNTARVTLDVQLDERAPLLTITDPADGTIVNGEQVTIRGTVSDNDAIASLRVNGTAVTADSNGEFTRQLALVPGNNTITVEARDRGDNLTTRAITVNRYVVPVVTITSPRDLAVLRDTTATITGTVSDPSASVSVNDVAASVSANGNYTATGVPLQQGRTVITANAISPNGGTATTSINLYRDSIPPRLEVYSPEDGATVYASPVSISGMVDDIVVGTINSQQMRVKVNGADAEVANRAFLMRNVALNAGLNTFSITAIDEGGNTTVVSYSLTYVPAPPKPHLEIVSGNGQSGTIGTALAAPLVVRAVASGGSPIAGATLTFEMDDNDGTVSDGTTTGSRVLVVTDALGRAQVQWTLGNRAGAGSHRVRISAAGYAAPLEAMAAATTGAPHLIVVDTGNNQFGITNDALPRPLVAIVVDAGNNRLENVPVTFTVNAGGGSFDGQPSIIVTTDSDGRAVVRPTLGPEPGEDNNIFIASVPGITSSAKFVASGRAAGPPAATTISGVIMDNSSLPMAGVSVRIDGTQIYTQTDESGQFLIANAPVGYVKLFIDGSTTTRPGTWPTLEYALYTLPGVDNSVGMPIYLVQLDTARGLFVDDTNGGTLTLPELPGFALEVKAGSATFPGGGRTGTVSATLVHADRIPMAPGFGQQPKFIVTIQPPGTHFDPPARLTLPNTDGLAPGASTEMYSFDHDLGQFVTIGSATVSADGSVFTSDPGTGIIKGGWHAGGDPTPGGGGSHCGECSVAVDANCIVDVQMEGGACSDDNIPATLDFCINGVPKHIVPRLELEVTSPEDHFNITGSPFPRMPRITANVRIFADDRELNRWEFRYNWKMTFRYQHDDPRVEVQEFTGTGENEPPQWQPDLLNTWKGGELTVEVTLVRNGVPTVKATWPKAGQPKVYVRGLNPSMAEINSYIYFNAQELAAPLTLIACHETFEDGRAWQFRPDPGLTTIGLDKNKRTFGVGLMQLTRSSLKDAPIGHDLYWNWHMNLAGGIRRFRTKYAQARASAQTTRDGVPEYDRDPMPEATDMTEDQILFDAIQRYNSGVFFKWNPAIKAWVGRPPLDPDGNPNYYLTKVLASRCN